MRLRLLETLASLPKSSKYSPAWPVPFAIIEENCNRDLQSSNADLTVEGNMDVDALTTVLDTALTQVHRVRTNVRKRSIDGLERDFLEELRETEIDYELSKIVLPVLEEQPEFKDKAPMVRSMDEAIGFQSQFAAPKLVREARLRKSASGAVAWLEKVLGTDRGTGFLTQTLWGISPTQRISIREGVELLPFESLPSSRQKEGLIRGDLRTHTTRLATPVYAWKSPTAALVAKIEVCPFLIDASIEQKLSDENTHSINSELDEIGLCLTLSGPSIILAGPSWFQYDDPDLDAAVEGGSTRYSRQEVLPRIISDLSLSPETDLPELVQRYVALEPSVKNRVRIALERLRQSLIRDNPADSTLEISIALESLLGSGFDGGRYKISLRASLLLTENIEGRMKARATLEAAYKMRNRLVHQGETKTEVHVESQGQTSAKEVAQRAANITALVTKRIIMSGGLPKWSQFELSNGSTW